MKPGATMADATTRIRHRFSNRLDTEHEQAFIRLIIGVLLLIYFLWIPYHSTQTAADWNVNVVGPILGFILVSVLLIIRIALHPQASPLRRILAATLDTSMATYFVYSADESALPLYFLYLWIVVGYGFRYGRGYLFYTLALSLAGFGSALFFQSYWIKNQMLGIGLWVGMLVVSLYVSALIGRLKTALQNAQAANEAKRRFVSSVSHELRTPLNAVIGMADLLRSTPLGVEQKDMVDSLNNASHAMLTLIEDVLDFSKIEAGKLSVESTEFDLHAVLGKTIDIFRYQAAQRGLPLGISVDPCITGAFRGDPRLLRQVLVNLLSNAVKFTNTGRIDLRVFPVSQSDADMRLHFEVVDTGIGIAAASQSRIFDSFTQADDSTSRRYGGTGLGTTISLQLVELMGGRMGLHSQEGAGSTFWFELNLQRAASRIEGTADLLSSAIADPSVKPAHDGARYRILAAEDNPINAKVLRKVLERAGHECELVENGRDALARIGQGEFDALILDMNMPVMNGLEAAAQYRARCAPEQRIPVIMFSANVTKEAIADALAAGVDVFLSKPIQIDHLLDTLNRLVGVPSTPQVERVANPQRDLPAKRTGDTAWAILDAGVLNQLEGMADHAFVDDLLVTFVEDNRARLGNLDEMVAASRFDEFRKTVHLIGGSATSVGAILLMQACLHAEQRTPLDRDGAVRELADINTAFNDLCEALGRYRTQHKKAASRHAVG